MKPTTEGDLLKMSDIIPAEEVDDTPLGMLYIIILEGQGCTFGSHHLGNITRCTDVQSKRRTHKAHVYNV